MYVHRKQHSCCLVVSYKTMLREEEFFSPSSQTSHRTELSEREHVPKNSLRKLANTVMISNKAKGCLPAADADTMKRTVHDCKY